MSSLLTGTVALLAFATASSGCLFNRTVVHIQESADHKVSVVETVDRYPLVETHQFWLCSEDASALVCTRACGGDNDLACHTLAFGSTNLQ